MLKTKTVQLLFAIYEVRSSSVIHCILIISRHLSQTLSQFKTYSSFWRHSKKRISTMNDQAVE